jgi:hypothetical protein
VKGGAPMRKQGSTRMKDAPCLTSAFRCGRHGPRSIPDLAFVCKPVGVGYSLHMYSVLDRAERAPRLVDGTTRDFR